MTDVCADCGFVPQLDHGLFGLRCAHNESPFFLATTRLTTTVNLLAASASNGVRALPLWAQCRRSGPFGLRTASNNRMSEKWLTSLKALKFLWFRNGRFWRAVQPCLAAPPQVCSEPEADMNSTGFPAAVSLTESTRWGTCTHVPVESLECLLGSQYQRTHCHMSSSAVSEFRSREHSKMPLCLRRNSDRSRLFAETLRQLNWNRSHSQHQRCSRQVSVCRPLLRYDHPTMQRHRLFPACFRLL